MRRLLLIILSGILAIGLLTGLTACTIDIKTDDGREIHIGPEMLEELEDLNWDEIMEGSSELQEKGQEFIENLQNAVEEGRDDLEDLLEELEGVDWEQLLETMKESSGESAGYINESAEEGQDTEQPDVYDPQDIMSQIQDILDENGYSEYLDDISSQIESHPEWLEEISNQFEAHPEWLEGIPFEPSFTDIQSQMPEEEPEYGFHVN